MTLPNKRDTIIIEGTTYDISEFKHPGGNIINYAKNSPDATEIFNEFHYRSSKAKNVLRSLPHSNDGPDVIEDKKQKQEQTQPIITQRQQEMTKDFREDACHAHRPRML